MTAAGTGRILLTGATGYVGGRLLERLERDGLRLRCLVRRPEALAGKTAPGTEVVVGDLLRPETLPATLEGVETAYYLVHSMGDVADFEAADRTAAENFSRAAVAAGVRRVIYLGGLAEEREVLSPHLRSRHEVGRILRAAPLEVIELRASIVIGSGSLSFEMIRALAERLPVMITPRWVDVPAQPIAIEDLLDYLVAALTLPAGASRVYEIGGADRASYGGIMREYAQRRGLRRVMLAVPVLTPRLSSLWLALVTPLYAGVGRVLIDSIRHPSVVRDGAAAARDFSVRPRGTAAALAAALEDEDRAFDGARLGELLGDKTTVKRLVARFGHRIVDSRVVEVNAPPEVAFALVQRIGGRNGWYFADWLWRLRGWIDRLAGGPGMSRGRSDAGEVRPGDVVDCWRVEAVEPYRRVRFRAEMKLPGRAWLEFEVTPHGAGTRLRQTAVFDPRGLGGRAYWYLLYPAHCWVFDGMLRRIAARAEAQARERKSDAGT
ncbi:MAG: SDR family oxidoreductase [Firmicutes bacterium]|nr:SDR family oxidoreductase [Bacillota bacterium]